MRIQNISGATKILHIWSCSKKRNWKTDNPSVSVADGPCRKSEIIGVTLKSGETHEEDLYIAIAVPKKEAAIAKQPVAESISFRLGYMDDSNINANSEFPQPIWSNLITTRITNPT